MGTHPCADCESLLCEECFDFVYGQCMECKDRQQVPQAGVASQSVDLATRQLTPQEVEGRIEDLTASNHSLELQVASLQVTLSRDPATSGESEPDLHGALGAGGASKESSVLLRYPSPHFYMVEVATATPVSPDTQPRPRESEPSSRGVHSKELYGPRQRQEWAVVHAAAQAASTTPDLAASIGGSSVASLGGDSHLEILAATPGLGFARQNPSQEALDSLPASIQSVITYLADDPPPPLQCPNVPMGWRCVECGHGRTREERSELRQHYDTGKVLCWGCLEKTYLWEEQVTQEYYEDVDPLSRASRGDSPPLG